MQRNVSESLNVQFKQKKKKLVLRDDTRLMVPGSEVPPVLPHLQSQSWPLGWLVGVSTKTPASVSFPLALLSVLTHYEEGKELLCRAKP